MYCYKVVIYVSTQCDIMHCYTEQKIVASLNADEALEQATIK